jgi:hypothetical protein
MQGYHEISRYIGCPALEITPPLTTSIDTLKTLYDPQQMPG